MKLEFLERQIGEGADKARLRGGVDKIQRIAKAGRHCRRLDRQGLRYKKCELFVFHVGAGVAPRR